MAENWEVIYALNIQYPRKKLQIVLNENEIEIL